MKNTLWISVIISIASFCSCNTSRYIYSASAPNNPYFTKKGESKLTGYYSTHGKSYSSISNDVTTNRTGFSHGWDLQGGYAISNHFAFIAEYYDKKEKDIYDYSVSSSPFKNSTVNYTRHLVETGVGYFVPLNAKKTITFNFYTGIAAGKFSFYDNGIDTANENYNRYHRADISKWFFQPSFHFMLTDYIRFGLILKNSLVHYGKISTSYTAAELKHFSLDGIGDKALYFYEPAWNLQLGIPKYPWIKLDIAQSVATVEPFYSNDIRHLNSSIGLCIDFSKMKN